MKNYLFHLLSIILLGIALSSCSAKIGKKDVVQQSLSGTRPNIVFIVADDLGWNDLSCYGNSLTETPYLDGMASAGIRFTDAYAGASLCSASRAALIAGLHPVRVNITEHMHGNQPAGPHQKLITPPIAQALGKEFPTIAELLKKANYQTAFFGKWHLGGGEFAPHHRGFDVNVGGSYHGLPASFFYPFFGEGRMPSVQKESKQGDYLTDVLTDKTLEYIEQQKDNRFLVYLSFYAPHVPIEAKADLVKKYEEKRRLNPGDTLPNIHYAAMVEAIDQNVGRVLEKLENLNLSENTIVIFTSDNGGLHVREVPAFAKHTPPMKNDPWRAGKGYLYEGGIREPYIVQWKGRIRPQPLNATPILGQDLWNTVADLAGLPDRTPDGKSLVPLLEGKSIAPRSLFWHVPHYTPQRGKPATAIRSGDYKLLEFYHDPRFELYNLRTDPGEQENLVNREKEKALALKAELAAWKKAMDAKLPRTNPNYIGEK